VGAGAREKLAGVGIHEFQREIERERERERRMNEKGDMARRKTNLDYQF